MSDDLWRRTLAYAFALFMAVMFSMLVLVMVIQAQDYLDTDTATTTLFVLAMLCILIFKLFEELLKATVKAIIGKKSQKTEPATTGQTEPDQLMSWLRIIFDREA